MKSSGNFAQAKYTYHLKMFKYFKTIEPQNFIGHIKNYCQ